MEKKKILFIIPWLPYPITTGGHHALFSSIKAVANDLDIYLAFEAINDDDYISNKNSFLKLFPNIHLLPLLHPIIKGQKQSLYEIASYKIKVSIWNFLHNIKSSKPASHDSNSIIHLWGINPQTKEWQNHINNIFTHYCFDFIQVEMPWFLSFILNLPENAIKIYVHHELGFVRRELEMNTWGYYENPYVKTHKKFIDIIEIGLLNQYDCIITLSETDAKKLEIKGVSKPIFPSFAAIEDTNLIDYQTCDGMQLVFIGSGNHQPNLIGLRFFLERCWESLLKKHPSYHLKIIGKWSQEHIKEFEEKYAHLNFSGFVDNLEEELKGSIMIVPITIGSGIRIKILEACSKSVPFVSTSIGAEGIPVVNDIHCFIADDAETFIDSIIKLQDRDIQKRFVNNSKKMILENYSMEKLRKNRLSIYHNMYSKNERS